MISTPLRLECGNECCTGQICPRNPGGRVDDCLSRVRLRFFHASSIRKNVVIGYFYLVSIYVRFINDRNITEAGEDNVIQVTIETFRKWMISLSKRIVNNDEDQHTVHKVSELYRAR